MRSRLWRAFVFLLVLALKAPEAVAQRPPVEAGAGFTRLIVNEYEDFFSGGPDMLGVDVRTTVPFSPRFSVEGVITVGQRNTDFLDRIEGLYLIQVKQRLQRATHGRFHTFLTYGAAGYWAHVSVPEVRIPQPGGGTTIRRRTTYHEIDQPLAAVIGVGVQHALMPHLAVRAEAQLITVLYIPIGPRFSAGVSIPVGRYAR